jgi:malonate-semialdehyde dehydrogenase (acetylating)/methylmalonate-semialdehyde dehydrogenase
MARIMELLKETGIPDGVINIVNGTVSVVEGICDHPQIEADTFVGSPKVDRRYLQQLRRYH